MKKSICNLLVALSMALVILYSCKKPDHSPSKNNMGITGKVMDESNKPVSGVFVSAYGESTTTGTDGTYSIPAITLPTDRIVVNFQKAGFFDAIVGAKPISNASTSVNTIMLTKKLIGSFNNTLGGNVSNTSTSIVFPAGAFKNPDGSAYSGNVNIYTSFIDPSSPNFGAMMPGGDFRAQDDNNNNGIMDSYGAVNVAAEKDDGSMLQLTMPSQYCVSISPDLLNGSPATIDVWVLSATGIWQKGYIGTKNGNKYCFSVPVTGGINCDMFRASAFIKGKVCDNSGNPAVNTPVNIGQLITYTGGDGTFSAAVPAGKDLTIITSFGMDYPGILTNDQIYSASIGCGGSGNGSGKFVFDGSTFSGTCIAVKDIGTGGPLGNIDVAITSITGKAFFIYNMPKQSSGTFTFLNIEDNDVLNGSGLYGIAGVGDSYGTESGTLTKTGTNSFTFSCKVYDIINSVYYTVTGSGSY